jgi:hypothetical protein
MYSRAGRQTHIYWHKVCYCVLLQAWSLAHTLAHLLAILK